MGNSYTEQYSDDRISELEKQVRRLQFGEHQTQILISQLKDEIRQLERANVELYFDGLRLHKWLIENNWMQHSNGRWYRSKDRHQWPPEEVCTEAELIHKYKRYISTC